MGLGAVELWVEVRKYFDDLEQSLGRVHCRMDLDA